MSYASLAQSTIGSSCWLPLYRIVYSVYPRVSPQPSPPLLTSYTCDEALSGRIITTAHVSIILAQRAAALSGAAFKAQSAAGPCSRGSDATSLVVVPSELLSMGLNPSVHLYRRHLGANPCQNQWKHRYALGGWELASPEAWLRWILMYTSCINIMFSSHMVLLLNNALHSETCVEVCCRLICVVLQYSH